MEMIKKNKNIVITVVVILLLVVAGFFITRGGGEDSMKKSDTDTILPDVETIPSVDESVEVTLDADAAGQEVTLAIDNYPEGTNSIEYELSYDAIVNGESVPKGVIGTIDLADGPASKDITLGTCSSGVCKYDKGVSLINVTLRFQGDYGAQLFEGEFEI